MLRHARMAAMRKLHRSVVWNGQSPVWAVHVGRGEIVWQDRCDAANGSKEPTVTVAAADTNVWLLYSCSKRATPKLSFAKASWRRITHSLQRMSWVRLKLPSLAHPRKEMRA